MFENAQATLILLIANVVLSFVAFRNASLMNWGLLTVDGVLKKQEYHRILTSGFLHINPLHLFVNMFTLFFFGPFMEALLGSRNFLALYLGALVAGSLIAVYVNRTNMKYAALGASGAVSGVVLAFCMFRPLDLLYLFGIIPIPAILFAVAYILYSIYGMGQENRIIGHEAHLGGAVGGVIMIVLMRPDALPTFLSEISSVL